MNEGKMLRASTVRRSGGRFAALSRLMRSRRTRQDYCGIEVTLVDGPMQRAPRFVEIVFEPVDVFAQLSAIASIPIGALLLALPSLELGDQLLAGERVPSSAHASVMAPFLSSAGRCLDHCGDPAKQRPHFFVRPC